ncbi:MAG: hypothetical protein AMS18_14065 [Gemmatimonas sp. SG8_17]|nr:MAG: hypothetical protein AMS18_14065 [Gemmatimonas sp. SG8_17]
MELPTPTLACLLFILGAAHLIAQEPVADTTGEALFVFEDCNARNCDYDHLRREITWVNWVRDREDSDVHLLVTAQVTGGNGWNYTVDYIGRRQFEGVTKSLTYISDPDDTDTEVREGLTQTIALGLVQFVESTPLASRLRVVYQEPEVSVVLREEHDPWNLWVFRVGAEGSLDGESEERAYSLEGSASADRVSEDLKINFRLSAEYDREEFDELDEGTTYVNVSEDYSARLLMVWSLNDRWSAGGMTRADRSTYLNQDLALALGPTVEYNVFPYQESTRRSITFRYSVEAVAFDYELPTVEGETADFLPRHSLLIAANLQQPWGEVFGSIEGIQYFHDLATHRINTHANVEYRLFRGFSLDIFTSFSRIKDQFFLPAEDLSPEEILLRRRQRETDYRYDFGVGFSYRFGSKFANIVNPRMDGGHH